MSAAFWRTRSGWNRAPFVPWMQWGGHAPPNSLKCFVSRGCQSRVKRIGRSRRSKRATVLLTRGMIASPSGTPSEPPGQKSFWPSTTKSASLRPMAPFPAVQGRLPFLKPTAGRDPCVPPARGERVANQKDSASAVVDEAARGPERVFVPSERGVVRRHDDAAFLDRDSPEPLERVGEAIFAD